MARRDTVDFLNPSAPKETPWTAEKLGRKQMVTECGYPRNHDFRRATGVAQHRFCRHCGIHPFYVPRSDPDKIDVNVRCLDEIDLSALSVRSFDGQHWEQAMQKDVPWR